LQRSAVNTLNFALKSSKFRKDNGLLLHTYAFGEPAFRLDQKVVTDPELTGISIDGAPYAGFNPLTKEYMIFAKNTSVLYTVSASAPADGTVQIIQATAAAPYTTILKARF